MDLHYVLAMTSGIDELSVVLVSESGEYLRDRWSTLLFIIYYLNFFFRSVYFSFFVLFFLLLEKGKAE